MRIQGRHLIQIGFKRQNDEGKDKKGRKKLSKSEGDMASIAFLKSLSSFDVIPGKEQNGRVYTSCINTKTR